MSFKFVFSGCISVQTCHVFLNSSFFSDLSFYSCVSLAVSLYTRVLLVHVFSKICFFVGIFANFLYLYSFKSAFLRHPDRVAYSDDVFPLRYDINFLFLYFSYFCFLSGSINFNIVFIDHDSHRMCVSSEYMFSLLETLFV